jgi:hypothetical protein
LDKSEIINTQLISNFPSVEVDIPVANYLWDLVYQNGKEIQNDFKIYTKGKTSAEGKFAGVNFVNKKNIFIGKDVDIKPGVVPDASTDQSLLKRM